MLEQVEWGEFKLKDLFEIVGTKSLDSNAIDFKENWINFIWRTYENNGIQGKIDQRDFAPNEPYTITATVIWNYKYVKYQKEPYYCSQNINKLTPKKIITTWSENIAYYFIANIQKFVSLYDNQQGWYKLDDMKNHVINVPVKDWKIDFNFMDKFIAELEAEHQAELEAEHQAELEAYLETTWLKNYELTSDELNTLNDFEEWKIEWKTFKIWWENWLFHIATGRDVIIWRTTEWTIPLISHQHENNGISKRISKLNDRRLFNYKTTLPLADRWVFLATTQNEDFHIWTRVKALTFKTWELSLNKRLFFVSSINMLQILFTEYADNATDSLPDQEIQLPFKNDLPDYEFMETFISAIQKLVIKDVVIYNQQRLKATADVISK